MFKVRTKRERSSIVAHTTKHILRHTLHQFLKDKQCGKLCPTLGINERQNWSNQEWMSPIITMVNNSFYSLSPLVIHFKWKAGNLEPGETKRAFPVLLKQWEERKIHFHFLPLLEWKWTLITATMTSILKKQYLNSSIFFIIKIYLLWSSAGKKNH